METVENVILEDISELREKLEGLDPSSKEYDAIAKRLDSLMDKAIKMGEFDIEQSIKMQQLEVEQANKEQQMNDDRKDRVVKNVISIGAIVLPVAVTIWGTLKSFKFEQEGTITTIMGRGFINKLLPKK